MEELVWKSLIIPINRYHYRDYCVVRVTVIANTEKKVNVVNSGQ